MRTEMIDGFGQLERASGRRTLVYHLSHHAGQAGPRGIVALGATIDDEFDFGDRQLAALDNRDREAIRERL
jgi:hypothetical protein